MSPRKPCCVSLGNRRDGGDTEHTPLWALAHDSGDTQTSAFRLSGAIWLETQEPPFWSVRVRIYTEGPQVCLPMMAMCRHAGVLVCRGFSWFQPRFLGPTLTYLSYCNLASVSTHL